MNKLNEKQKVAMFTGIQSLFFFLTLLSLIFFKIITIEEVGIPALAISAYISFFCLSSIPFIGD